MSEQSHPDLTLPRTAPSVGHFHDKPMELRPAALYTLVNFTDAELRELQQVCESETFTNTPGSNVRLAPRSSFVGQSLRAIFDYHLEQNEQNEQDPPLDPTHFIVAFDKDWKGKGVLLVTLDDDDLECKTDSFRIKAEHSGITFVGIRIGNTDWSEAKDLYSLPVDEENHTGGDDDNPDDDDDDDDDQKPPSPLEPTPPDDPGSPTLGPIPPSAPAAKDSTSIAVYALLGVDVKKLIVTLEPNGARKDPKNFNCRLQAILSSSSDLVKEAMDLHPKRSTRNPFLHKFLFLIADTPDFVESGVVLASLGGKVKDKVFPEKATQRVACSARATYQDVICMMAQGLRGWAPPEDLHCVYVFRWSGSDGAKKQRPETVAPLLDPKWDRRLEGEERIILAGNRLERKRGQLPKAKEWDLRSAVEKWPEVCWEQRFNSNFSRKYFVAVDNGDAEKEGVLLVKVEWDGDVSAGKEQAKSRGVQLMGEEGKVETWRVAVGDAYEVVKAVIDGTREWEGVNVDWKEVGESSSS
ncbi:hypothetical protein QBC43DRAFT_270623 [Cladorrhinum sp. PSN259]|nr:hypothetical protein QBC43DRAFT_270623 [Cladorrhinum sp. PSN259]